jgi:hypothetical protein
MNIIVTSESQVVTFDNLYDDDAGVTYTPFYDAQFGVVGYIAEGPTGDQETIYLNPSQGSDDGKPNVFLYQEDGAGVTFDSAVHHYLMFEENP